MGTCLSGELDKKLNGGMCLMKTSDIKQGYLDKSKKGNATNSTSNSSIACCKNNNNNSKTNNNNTSREVYSCMLGASTETSSSSLLPNSTYPATLYLPDGEEKYFTPSSSSKNVRQRRRDETARLEMRTSRDADNESPTSSSCSSETNDSRVSSAASTDNDNFTTAQSNMQIRLNAPPSGGRPIPLRWPGEYGTCVSAPPNRTVLSVNSCTTTGCCSSSYCNNVAAGDPDNVAVTNKSKLGHRLVEDQKVDSQQQPSRKCRNNSDNLLCNAILFKPNKRGGGASAGESEYNSLLDASPSSSDTLTSYCNNLLADSQLPSPSSCVSSSIDKCSASHTDVGDGGCCFNSKRNATLQFSTSVVVKQQHKQEFALKTATDHACKFSSSPDDNDNIAKK